MTDPTPLTDPELEGRLRTLLHERASTITGSAPDLPATSSALTVVHPPHNHRRWAVAGVAAACVALIAAVVALAAPDHDVPPDRVVTTQPSVPDSVGAGPAASLFHINGHYDAEEVAREFLRVRLGDGTPETDAVLRDQVDLRAGDPVAHGTEELVPVTWTRPGEHGPAADVVSTIWVRPGDSEADVVGATIDGVDPSGVRYETGSLTGRITAPASTDGNGTTTTATLTRRIAMPLLEPDAAVRADEGEPLAATVPLGDPFSIPMTSSGDLELTVRVTDDATGEVVGVAMTTLAAPSDPDLEGWDQMTEAERKAAMQKQLENLPSASESPGCKEAGAFRMPQLGGFPNEVPAVATRAVGAIDGTGSTPADAADALATSLGIDWEVGDVALGALDAGSAIARLPGGRLVDLDLWKDPDLGAWRVTGAKTRGACRDFAGSNVTPLGAPNPKTALGVPVVAGAVDGSIWYRTDGATQRVDVTDHDLSTRWINVPADQAKITNRITVLRDASGAAVLVDLSPEINVPG